VAAILQPTLFGSVGEPSLGSLADLVERTTLSDGAWIDVARGWVQDDGSLFRQLHDDLPWEATRRPMYDRVVDVPRLLAFYGVDAPPPHPLLGEARTALSSHYRDEKGGPFATFGCCLYRDGRDSVAPHGDRIGRGRKDDTLVAIISLGATRRLTLQRRTGGRSLAIAMAHGDLVVMGGSCQRTWDHAIPKTARRVGPRISVQLRPAGVR
jgi:alkylated DNA repair dioxygenase AlkB